MKRFTNRTLMIFLAVFSGYGYIISCTHEDITPPAPASTTPTITRGTNVHLPGNLTAGNTTEWKVDKAHSGVLVYYGQAIK